jgi:hypothetical protein
MNIGSYLQFGNMLRGVYDANQQALVNRQNQQRINDLLANDALMRQIRQQQFQDYLTATQGEGAFYRGLANNAFAPASVSASAPAPAPGQDSAKQPAPPEAVPIPGATAMQPLSAGVTAQKQDIQSAPPPAAPSTPAFGPRQQFSGISTPQQVIDALKAKKMSPNAAVSILSDMAKRGDTPSSAQPADAPQAPQNQESDTGLPAGAFGRVLALAQNNQIVNLAAQAAANLLKANPNMSDRELALAMNAVNPTLAKQSDNMLQLAGLSNTQLFRAVDLMLRQQSLAARYPGYSDGPSPYTPQQLAVAADMLRNGQTIPMAMKPWVYEAYPDLAPEAMQGKARQAAAVASATEPIAVQKAINIAQGTSPIIVQREVNKISAAAAPRANSGALTQVEKTLAALEPAYDALHTNFEGLIQAAKKYGLGPATPINVVLNRLRSAGDPDYTSFYLFLKAVQKEFGKILQASTGARGVSVAAMKDAEGTLSGNMTLGQLEAAQKALETEGANVLNSLRKQRDTLTSRLQGSNATRTMSPEDQQALEWARTHSSDPRAGKISQYLKEKYGL